MKNNPLWLPQYHAQTRSAYWSALEFHLFDAVFFTRIALYHTFNIKCYMTSDKKTKKRVILHIVS